MIRSILLVAIGCAVGGVGRYLVSVVLHSRCTGGFPYATFLVNVIGSALIGMVFAWGEKHNISHSMRLLLVTGVLGGFTTFSAFSMETIKLLQEGNTITALSYVLLSLLGGLGAVALMYYLTR